MITNATLKSQTMADLARMAKDFGISGWQSMRKEQLVTAVIKASKRAKSKPTPKSLPKSPPKKSPSRISKAISQSKRSAPVVSKKIVEPKIKSGRSFTGKAFSGKVEIPAPKGPKIAKNETPSRQGKSVLPSTVAGTKNGSAKVAASRNGSVKTQVANEKAIAKPAKPVPKKPIPKPAAKKPEPNPTNPKVLQRIREIHQQREADRDLSYRPVPIAAPHGGEPIIDGEPQKDRIALLVRDAYWLHVSWDLTRQAVERARAAMAEHWHTAHPILRLLRLDGGGTTNTAETVERDIPIHGGVRNWYIDLNGMPGRFRVLIGYLAGNGRFHTLAKSNIVNSPVPGSNEAIDDHWSDIAVDPEKFFALSGGYDSEQETGELKELFEERLKRSMGTPALAKFGSGAETGYRRNGEFYFDMDVELLIYGATVPDGYVTLSGEPVKLHPDGTFAIRHPFPDRRQVLPAVACSRDGVQQRTVVVAVERNTKVMEPLSKEQDEHG